MKRALVNNHWFYTSAQSTFKKWDAITFIDIERSPFEGPLSATLPLFERRDISKKCYATTSNPPKLSLTFTE